MIEILNESNFTEKVLEANGKVLVELFATWCPHCQRMAPIVDELAEEESGRVKVYRVDVDKSPDLADKYAPEGFPTFALFENGVEIDHVSGERSIQDLKQFISLA